MQLFLSMIGGAQPQQAAPQGDPIDLIFDSLIQQESGGRAGVLGPQTRYGRAEGLTQMLPATARETAERNGIPWRPELMRGTSPEAAEYQRRLGRLYFEEGLRETGNVRDALRYYHGGPNRDLWGPRTNRYAEEVLARAGAAIPQGGQANPFASLFQSIDPQTAMGMIPAPILNQPVVLPAAPQQEMPSALPPHALADVETLLAEMRAASRAPERDSSNDSWERISALLGGAAAGAAGADPYGGLGQMILAAGAGGQAGFANERDAQRGLDRENALLQGQLDRALAGMGLDLNLQNLATSNANRDREWQSGENVRQTRWGNVQGADARVVEQILTNAGISQGNVAALNQNQMARAQAGLGAMEGQVAAANQGTALGVNAAMQLAMQGFQQATDPRQADRAIGQMIRAAGVPESDSTVAVARAIAAGNNQAVLPYIATDLMTSGLYSSMLAEEDAQAVERALQREQGEQALAIVTRALAASPVEAVRATVDDLAAQGSPAALLIQRARANAGQQ